MPIVKINQSDTFSPEVEWS